MPCIYKNKRNNKVEEYECSSCQYKTINEYNKYKEENMKKKLKEDKRLGSGDRRSCTFYTLVIPERRKEKRRKKK